MMKGKFSLLLFLCALSFWGQAQSSSLQELVNKRQFQEVLKQAHNLTAADSADYATMSAIGQAYEGLLRYKEAYTCFRYCLKMDTANVDALNAVARNALNFGRVAEAERCYEKVLATDSTNFYACYQLARLYFQLGEYGKSIEYYHILSSTEGENPSILTGLADCHMKIGGLNIIVALNLYARALELNPENVRVASSLINTLLQTGNGVAALQVCDTALYYNPVNRQIRQSKGMALYLTKKYAQADSVYTSLLAEGDSSFLNLKYAGAARYMAGHILNAVEPLELAFDLDTTDVETALLYGAAIGKTYDRKRAHELFDVAEQNMKPKRLFVNLLTSCRGDVLRRERRYDEAEKLYYEAWKNDPSQLNFLAEIDRDYWIFNSELPKDETKYQKMLFIKYTYLTSYIDLKKTVKNLYDYRPFLEAAYEDAFFRSKSELSMLAPDGKKSKLSVLDLRYLINRLPEIPEEEKKRRADLAAKMKRTQEKNVQSLRDTNIALKRASVEAEKKAAEEALKKAGLIQ